MKIGIITLPLHYNYGGCLQAYALQHTIDQMGHKAYILSIRDKSIKFRIKSILKGITPIGKFQRKNIRTLVLQEWSLQECKKHQLDAIIVGSDQVWRKVYTNDNYFLGFLSNDNSIKRLAYAASFSVDYMEFEENTRNKYKDFLQKFNAISVREDTAIGLLEKYFFYSSAVHVLDPTMLLDVAKYKKC